MSRQALMHDFETLVSPIFYDGASVDDCLVGQVEQKSLVVQRWKEEVGYTGRWGDGMFRGKVVALAYEVDPEMVREIFYVAADLGHDFDRSLKMAREALGLTDTPAYQGNDDLG